MRIRWKNEDIVNAVRRHSGLSYDPGLKRAEGTINLQSANKEILESFEIKIVFPFWHSNYVFPIVSELSDKIPRAVDRHMYTDGRMCLATEINQVIALRNGLTPQLFFQDVLLPFLATQVLLTEGEIDNFPQGERSHGNKGVLESYQEYLRTNDIDFLLSKMKDFIATKKPNKKFIKPVKNSPATFILLDEIPTNIVSRDYNRLQTWVKNGMSNESIFF